MPQTGPGAFTPPSRAPREREQGDLFSGRGDTAIADATPSETVADPRALSDAALIAAIPHAGQSACRSLALEAARRRLVAAVPALEALCRRFKGFGLRHTVAEQAAALPAMAAIGGAEAVAAIRRIIVQDVVAGPGLTEAVRAAAALRCILPEETAATLLRHPDPAIRALACRCTPRSEQSAGLLASLLEDLNPGVATEAAKGLARMGRPDGRGWLLRLLAQQPDADVLGAIAVIADDECAVLLGRIARSHPALREAAVQALESIETPRAGAVLASLATVPTAN
ncbi:MAG TPA: HEAT repeat domain-containing protein [Acetobacteraceae bacterium]|nr:HEAT repeat domain-containing protein [Acetobacteraceae bacterium]